MPRGRRPAPRGGAKNARGPTIPTRRASMRSAITTLIILFSVSSFATAEAVKPAGNDTSSRTLRLGAVCLSPKTVTVFSQIRYYLGQRGLPVEYTLYSH